MKLVRQNVFLARVAFTGAALLFSQSALGGDCEPFWDVDAFPEGGPNSIVYVAEVMPVEDGPPWLVVGGLFTEVGGIDAAHIAAWDGTEWRTFGDGFNAAVRALAVAENAAGEATLFAGGEFTMSGETEVLHIAQWTGEAWEPVGDGVNDDVLVIEPFGTPGHDHVYVGGRFNQAGETPALSIARWDGESWSALGDGLIAPNTRVEAIAFDPQHTVEEPRLYAGGVFIESGSQTVNRIGRWDGTTWTQLANGVNGQVLALTVYGEGDDALLIAGGGFNDVGEFVAAWDGQSWHELGDGLGSIVRSLIVHDDGTGPALYAGGNFDHNSDTGWLGKIAKWSGTQWEALDSGVGFGSGNVWALTSINDESGPGLILAGAFQTINWSIPAERIARWQSAGTPQILAHPDDQMVTECSAVTIEAEPEPEGQLVFQWTKDGEPIDDADDDRITGADTPLLTIEPVHMSDAGVYALVVTNDCGSATSIPAELTVEPREPSPDINGDGVVNVDDLLLVLNQWGPAQDPCGADITGSGVVNVDDLLLVLNSWGEVE